MKYRVLVIIIIGLFNSCQQKIKSAEELSLWLSGKEFSSSINDYNQYNSDGSVSSPVCEVSVKFYKNKLVYQACQPCSYTITRSSNSKIYKGESWEISFRPNCKKDEFSLVITDDGKYFLISLAYDYDKALYSGTGALNRMNAILDREIKKGPDMEITNENIVINNPITENIAGQEIAAPIPTDSGGILPSATYIVNFNQPMEIKVKGNEFVIYEDEALTTRMKNPYKMGDRFFATGMINSNVYVCYDPSNSEKKFYIPTENNTQFQNNGSKEDNILNTDNNIEDNPQEINQYNLGWYIISSDKSYFYSSSNENSIKKSYLIKGDSVYLLNKVNLFGEIRYISKTGKKTETYIKLADIQ